MKYDLYSSCIDTIPATCSTINGHMTNCFKSLFRFVFEDKINVHLTQMWLYSTSFTTLLDPYSNCPEDFAKASSLFKEPSTSGEEDITT